jgi:hypothetical protein
MTTDFTQCRIGPRLSAKRCLASHMVSALRETTAQPCVVQTYNLHQNFILSSNLIVTILILVVIIYKIKLFSFFLHLLDKICLDLIHGFSHISNLLLRFSRSGMSSFICHGRALIVVNTINQI